MRKCICGECEYCQDVEHLANEIFLAFMESDFFCPKCRKQISAQELFPNHTVNDKFTWPMCCGEMMKTYDPVECN